MCRWSGECRTLKRNGVLVRRRRKRLPFLVRRGFPALDTAKQPAIAIELGVVICSLPKARYRTVMCRLRRPRRHA
jgi:hypothetical protein